MNCLFAITIYLFCFAKAAPATITIGWYPNSVCSANTLQTQTFVDDINLCQMTTVFGVTRYLKASCNGTFLIGQSCTISGCQANSCTNFTSVYQSGVCGNDLICMLRILFASF